MKRPPNYFIFLVFAMAMGGIGRAGIIVDYTHDGGFFASNAAAKSALEAAVADINAILDLNLGAITNDTTVGLTSGTTKSEHDFAYTYKNPSNGGTETISDTTLGANEFRLFVGMSNLDDTALGQAGPGGASVNTTLTSGSGAMQDAFDDAVAKDQHRRGDGPVIASLSGGTFSGETFTFDLGPSIGSATFDIDTDNNDVADSASLLEMNWHFDHTTSVANGKDDFYTVALHETLHAIGYGASATWNDLVSGTDWTGSEAIAEYGTGTGLISGDGGHLANGVMSTRLSDGVAQEAVMTGVLVTGTRRTLTSLDAAIIRDLGYSTVAVPEPSSLLLFGGAMFGVFRRRRRVVRQLS